MIIDHIGDGGAQQFLKRLSEELSKQQFRVIVCPLQPSRNYEIIVLSELFETITLSHRRFGLFGFFLLIRLIHRLKPDIIHTHLNGANIFGVIAARLNCVRKIFSHDHSGTEYINRFPILAKSTLLPLERFLARFLVKLFVVSNHVADLNIRVKKISPNKIVVLPNWIDFHQFTFDAADREQNRAAFGLSATSFVIGAVGRLSPEKGLTTLVESFAIISKSVPNSYLLIAGDGPEKRALELKIKTLNLSERVRLIGFTKDTKAVYSTLDLFILPSHYETFGIALLEAMYCGLPVIASNVGGVPDLVRSGFNGILVEPNNSAQLTSSILNIISDKRLRNSLGSNARISVTEKFDRDALLNKLLHYYQIRR
jgi:glycosyltransferase involved in cell wall biosynthesis